MQTLVCHKRQLVGDSLWEAEPKSRVQTLTMSLKVAGEGAEQHKVQTVDEPSDRLASQREVRCSSPVGYEQNLKNTVSCVNSDNVCGMWIWKSKHTRDPPLSVHDQQRHQDHLLTYLLTYL